MLNRGISRLLEIEGFAFGYQDERSHEACSTDELAVILLDAEEIFVQVDYWPRVLRRVEHCQRIGIR